jgi:hypothetical protein
MSFLRNSAALTTGMAMQKFGNIQWKEIIFIDFNDGNSILV